jgi:hypothetical protein
MTMRSHRLTLRLAAHASAFGASDALVGDLLEEIALGRSRLWVCQQLIGMYGFSLLGRLRGARLTPPVIAMIITLALVAGASLAPAKVVLAVWLGFYYVAGTLSLFAHMASRSAPSIDNR